MFYIRHHHLVNCPSCKTHVSISVNGLDCTLKQPPPCAYCMRTSINTHQFASPCLWTPLGCGTWSRGNSPCALCPVERIFKKMNNHTWQHQSERVQKITRNHINYSNKAPRASRGLREGLINLTSGWFVLHDFLYYNAYAVRWIQHRPYHASVGEKQISRACHVKLFSTQVQITADQNRLQRRGVGWEGVLTVFRANLRDKYNRERPWYFSSGGQVRTC